MLFFLDICFCVPKRQTHQCVFQTNGNASNTLAMKHLENILPYLWMRFPGPCKCIHVYASPQSINLWPCDGALRSDRAILIVRSCVCVRGRLSLQGFIHPRWCRISSINSTVPFWVKNRFFDSVGFPPGGRGNFQFLSEHGHSLDLPPHPGCNPGKWRPYLEIPDPKHVITQ